MMLSILIGIDDIEYVLEAAKTKTSVREIQLIKDYSRNVYNRSFKTPELTSFIKKLKRINPEYEIKTNRTIIQFLKFHIERLKYSLPKYNRSLKNQIVNIRNTLEFYIKIGKIRNGNYFNALLHFTEIMRSRGNEFSDVNSELLYKKYETRFTNYVSTLNA